MYDGVEGISRRNYVWW